MPDQSTGTNAAELLFLGLARHAFTLPRAEESVADLVETLMGRKPELRFRFIQENAEFAAEDVDL